MAQELHCMLWVFKTYEPSEAKSSHFCAVFILAPVGVCQGKIENLCMHHIFQTLNHVVICRAISAGTAACCHSMSKSFMVHPAPLCSKTIPSMHVQKHSRTTSNELAQK